MIKITVELLPFGSERDRYILGKGVIVNDGTGTVEVGNYLGAFSLSKDGKGVYKYSGEVKEYRRQEGDVWLLISTMLQEAINNNASDDSG